MTSTEACRFFAKGFCLNGDQCRFQHVSPPLKRPTNSSSPNINVSENVEDNDRVKRKSTSSLKKVQSTPIQSSWINAPEFVPRGCIASESFPSFEPNDAVSNEPTQDQINSSSKRSWAQVVNPEAMARITVSDAESQLCPFGELGECRYGEYCAYIHGDICDMCGKATLHPHHEEQQKEHKQSCLKQHEKEMEIAFAIAKSKEKTCGICMDVILEKPEGENRFGILPNCCHCFCLTCLRKWRQQANFESTTIRSCPECRQTSYFICPSSYWVETKEEKEKLFAEYKTNLDAKECKYFKRGEGECPFGNKCFYKHCNKNGERIDVGPPKPRRSNRFNADGDEAFMNTVLFYDFLDQRNEVDDDFEIISGIINFLDFFTDSDSETDFLL